MNANAWIDEDAFLRGYLDAAVWTEVDPYTGEPLENAFSVENIDADWLREATEDCRVFCRNNGFKLHTLGSLTARGDEALGHDFWLTRQGAGSGYWDRYLEARNENRSVAREIGGELSVAAREYDVKLLMPIGEGKIGE